MHRILGRMSDEDDIEKTRPWALALKDCVDAVKNGKQWGTISLGQIILMSCERRGIAQPPYDVETAILRIMVKAAMGEDVVIPAPIKEEYRQGSTLNNDD